MEQITQEPSPIRSPSSRTIPFLDLKKLVEPFREEIDQAIKSVLDRSQFIGGPELDQFEKDFASWVGENNFVVGCSNGTDALTLAALAMDLPKGSEAILPAMTFFATATAIARAGLKIKLVDVDPDSGLMSLNALESAISESTSLIVPVHLYGQMVAMDRVRAIAEKRGCRILEDAAQAHGAKWRGKPVGFWGDMASFSFFPGKNLGAFGDAGAILTKDPELSELTYALSHQGGRKKYQHDYPGSNCRLDNLQAAILGIKLKRLSQWNLSRQKVADYYFENLKGIDGLKLPFVSKFATSVFHLFVVQVEHREKFQKYLKDHGVSTGIHYPKAIHELGAFQHLFEGQSFSNAERFARHGVSLPMCPTLSKADLAYVVKVIQSYFN